MTVNQTILLTGGTGFLGSNLLQRLVKDQYRIILLKRSSSDTSRINDYLPKLTSYDIDQTDLRQIIRNNRIDIIIHCATNYGRSEIDPIALLEANLILPLKVYATEILCINIALEHFYGPHDDQTKFVTYIIRNILANIEKIDLTKGEQKRDFIYIDDVVDAFLKVINHSALLERGFLNYEIGTNHAITIKEFVSLVKRLANNSSTYLNFGVLPYRDNEIMESFVDTSEIRKLGWKPNSSLEDGLLKTINSEREHNNR